MLCFRKRPWEDEWRWAGQCRTELGAAGRAPYLRARLVLIYTQKTQGRVRLEVSHFG